MVIRCIIKILLIFCVYTLESKTLVKHSTKESVEYIANGHRFMHDFSSDNGRIQEKWLYDGTEVSYEEYQNYLVKAEMEEYQKREQAEREQLDCKKYFSQEARATISRRLIRLNLDTITKLFEQIKDYELEPYLQWHNDTIPSRSEYDVLITSIIPAYERQSNNLVDPEQLSHVIQQLEGYAERLNDLIQHTLKYVINNSNDTQLLKRLLMIL